MLWILLGISCLAASIGGYSTWILNNLTMPKSFGVNSWHVVVEAEKKNKHDDYDVIVVGAGMGGLTSAALLSQHGYKVLVAEQQEQIGGFCTSFERNGFTFNVGVADVSGLGECGGATTYLLNKLDLKRDDLFIKNKRRFLIDGHIFTFSEKNELIEQLIHSFPREKKKIKKFFINADAAMHELNDAYLRYQGVSLTQEMLIDVLGYKGLINYSISHPHIVKLSTKTYKQYIDHYFKNESLKNIFNILLVYLGTQPESTPAIHGLGACISYLMYGGYFPKNGASSFAKALQNVIEKNGGVIKTECVVNELCVEDNAICGVRCGEKIYKSSIVVANANARTVLLKMLPKDVLPESYCEQLKAIKMSPSLSVVHLGVDIDFSQFPSLINDIDNDCHILLNSAADAATAPEGKGSLSIYAYAYSDKIPSPGTAKYAEYKKECLENALKKAEKIIPSIREKILEVDIETPHSFERYTGMPNGSIYSFDNSIGSMRPYFRTPVKGLYLASASTLYGGGVEAVIMSGIACYHDIVGWHST